MKTIWIILIICVIVAVLCALAWCCHLFAGNKEYNDTRQRYSQPDLEIGLVEPVKRKPDRYISQPRTLRVKRLPHNFDGIPMILQRKHFTEPPITPIKATGIFSKTSYSFFLPNWTLSFLVSLAMIPFVGPENYPWSYGSWGHRCGSFFSEGGKKDPLEC